MPEGRTNPVIRPAFATLATIDVPAPDYLDLIAVPLSDGAPDDPRLWAEVIFSPGSAPLWVIAAMGVRQLLAPLLGASRGERHVFDVDRVVGEEALIVFDDRHLDFRCGVGVDPAARLVRVTTAVRLHGWRGRVYFTPVRLAHPAVVHGMLRRAARRLGRPRTARRLARRSARARG